MVLVRGVRCDVAGGVKVRLDGGRLEGGAEERADVLRDGRLARVHGVDAHVLHALHVLVDARRGAEPLERLLVRRGRDRRVGARVAGAGLGAGGQLELQVRQRRVPERVRAAKGGAAREQPVGRGERAPIRVVLPAVVVRRVPGRAGVVHRERHVPDARPKVGRGALPPAGDEKRDVEVERRRARVPQRGGGEPELRLDRAARPARQSGQHGVRDAVVLNLGRVSAQSDVGVNVGQALP